MSYRTFALEFSDGQEGRVGTTPTARIKVATGTGFGALSLPYIAADCKTQGEIDFQINHLIEELESIRREAQTKFRQS